MTSPLFPENLVPDDLESLTFPQAIAHTQAILERQDLSDDQLQQAITRLISTANGARGFFVSYLMGDWELADDPSDSIVAALRAESGYAAELLVKNLAMSTAMAIAHRRNGNEAQAQGSEQVARRSANLIKLVNLKAIKTIAQQMQDSAQTGMGEYGSFLDKWGYDHEQKLAIANCLNI